MKALSLWQPWATLVAIGAKRYETRSYPTGVRGRVAIHAAKKHDKDCIGLCFDEPFSSALVAGGIERIGDLPFGAVVCVVGITGCSPVELIRDSLTEEERAFGDFRDGRFAWSLALLETFDVPIPAVGKQGFWFWKPETAQKPGG